MARVKRDPRTKEEVLNRMLSYDFDGDIRNLGEQPASIVRTGAHTLRLIFPASGTVFDVTIHRPREFAQNKRAAVAPPEQRTFKQGRARVTPVPGMEAPPAPAKRVIVRRKKGETAEQAALRRQEAMRG